MSEENTEPTCNKSKMGKAIVYTALIIVCLGIGVLIGGLGVYYGKPFYEGPEETIQTKLEAKCFPRSNGRDSSNIGGEITLSQTSNNPLKIYANIVGLPTELLGFHVHTYGVVDYNCTSAGGHFNPHDKKHGGPLSDERHLGDLGNIDASRFPIEITDNHASLFGENSILGRSIVIHEKQDDLKDQTSAGGRLACCTIQRNS